MLKLKNKVAVVYSNGAIGSAIAKAFAREGAIVFLAGRTPAKLETIADEIISSGGQVETAQVDALDEPAVELHMNNLVKKAGKIDISFNAIGLPRTGIPRAPLAELSVEDFSKPISIYTRSHFITAKAAVRQMIKQKNGVIMMHVPDPSRTSAAFLGGRSPAYAAIESLCRSLSLEYAQEGIRTLCLLTTGLPETPLVNEAFNNYAKAHNMSYEQFLAINETRTHRKRMNTLAELANTAVFAASDEGSAFTGTTLNLTSGMIV
jgi:NAD(P)-dependent dehydrogenase (short-subunit alcohol dehydrogenase family)